MMNNNHPHILQYMRDYNNRTRPEFNDNWFQRKDEDIIRGIQNIILSFQKDRFFTLRVISFKLITDYNEINKHLWKHYSTKTKNGKKEENPYDYIQLKDSDISLLLVKYYIRINIDEKDRRKDPKTKQLEILEGEFPVYIMIPRYVDKYYMRIQGNYYAPQFQIVDGSTYNNNTSSSSKSLSVTQKTIMPIKMYKETYKLTDVVTNDIIHATNYTTYIFAKKNDTMKYILGMYGYYGTKHFLGLNEADIHIGKTPYDSNMYYNFKCKDKHTIISVPRYLFDRENIIQSLVVTLSKIIHDYNSWIDIFKPEYFAKSLGGDFKYPTLEKGVSVLDSIEIIYDIDTRQNLHLPDEEKENIYQIIRWMMREFGNLRKKDNLDISTKKARMADGYLPNIYGKRLLAGINRASDKGKEVRYMDVVRAVNIDPDILITSINSSKLVNYVDLVNDNDAEIALSFTYKGLSGIGENDNGSSSAIPIIYRSIHPSHLGRLDLDASSASDPGMSGVIAPMSEEYGYSFSEYMEPMEWQNEYNTIINSYNEEKCKRNLLYFMDNGITDFPYMYTIKDNLIKEVIERYNKAKPAIIDINGKIDYTVNEYMELKESLDINVDNTQVIDNCYNSDGDDVCEEVEEEE